MEKNIQDIQLLQEYLNQCNNEIQEIDRKMEETGDSLETIKNTMIQQSKMMNSFISEKSFELTKKIQWNGNQNTTKTVTEVQGIVEELKGMVTQFQKVKEIYVIDDDMEPIVIDDDETISVSSHSTQKTSNTTQEEWIELSQIPTFRN
ncbi:hypothetical protein EDI_192250 [Entamoeba dispar SAW760]|uniref:Uncharacterized protein n=1 Tax=Entamoeba dispar (strain ATCC PRA-260 / SAW760) TaxID=370354 RepID=B0EI03_ENTDS|nr:uncharacterized protein EDI_192250 [Entamoeba dispar SAW760]EDR25844.1 hypothetical protein EDI_192250 [Entamoeba dispar SAW760]|eukprot:EDR25844.1 hypothetical protein EDI_192250 [Entamoeba dispar SAW760]